MTSEVKLHSKLTLFGDISGAVIYKSFHNNHGYILLLETEIAALQVQIQELFHRAASDILGCQCLNSNKQYAQTERTNSRDGKEYPIK